MNAQLNAEYAVTRQVRATIGVRNLFGQDYRLTSGYSGSGRSYYATVRIS